MFIGFIFILGLLSFSILLLLMWAITGKKVFGKTLGIFWLFILFLIGIGVIYKYFTTPVTLDQEDIYGTYIIDRTTFPGYQADWQYDHFRFEITKQDSIYFYVTEENKIIQTYQGTIAFHPSYKRPRLIINMDEPRHHIIEDYPTLYREVRNFYYVFNSPNFGNVFLQGVNMR